ncbi:hypothetical protein A4H97_15190 [Niastella yeongjuensis]|uniref:Uncharacterized protein n=1 Tax=Niastella yeongjuensis TaxID=354355 RepID=A0A1V9E489_9BACT|nr:hypothetical protein [Niastella yeongjuensis]OQP40947.1 hypothetical protein A4H97_15190 [Niastella yeongjuensis]SEO96979.1 hypothetical protein SAMN05660816_04013 [Niastella yeongjuensis]
MKSLIPILGIMLSVSVVFSCKKHSGDEGSNGTVLSKIIVRGSSNLPSGSIEVNKYYYDAQNRITGFDYLYGDAAKDESGAKYVSTTKWFYKGDEQLPYKYTQFKDSIFVNEMYFFYDNQGRLATDSFLPNVTHTSYTIRQYNWYVDKLMIISAIHAMGTIAMRTDSFQINNHNVLAQFGTSYPLGQGIPATYYTYDNNINPIHALNIHAAIPLGNLGGINNNGYSENNPTEMKTGFIPLFGGPGGYTPAGTLTYKYNYNEHNLPVDCEATGDGNIVGSLKTNFYYTTLIR